MSECEWCLLIENEVPGGVHAVTPSWNLNAAVGATDRPWFVLQSIRHIANTSQLNTIEAQELGLLTQQLSKAIENIPGVDRVYSLLMNDNPTPHVHVHFTVSTVGDPKELRGARLLSAPLPAGVEMPSSANLINDIVKNLSAGRNQEPSPLVRFTVIVGKAIRDFKFAPSNLLRNRKGGSAEWRGNFPDWYFPLWVVMLGAALPLAPLLNSNAQIVIAVIAIGRLVQMAAVHLVMLLDREANSFRSYERSVALLIVNVFELALSMSILYVTLCDLPIQSALAHGISTALLNAGLSESNPTMLSIEIFGTTLSALLLFGAVGTMVGRVASVKTTENP